MSSYQLLYKKLNKNTEYQNFSPNMKKHFCCFVVVLVKPRHINLLRKRICLLFPYNFIVNNKSVYVRFSSVQFSSVAQSCPTLCDPLDCSLPGPSLHGILQARILEWIAIPFSRGSSRLGD